MMNGGDLYRLQAFLGHSTPVLTQRYAHLAPGHLVTMDRNRLSFRAPAGSISHLHTGRTQQGVEPEDKHVSA